ncbi:MAG: hypothetical protein WC789_04905 [Lentisphaeria bacterium]
MTNKPDAPQGLALLVCDTILEDRHTGKKSLIGLFDGLHAAQFPCVHPVMHVVVELSNITGKKNCRLVCRHGDGDAVAFDAKGEVDCPDTSRVVQLAFGFRGVKFEKPGVWWISIYVNDEQVMTRPLAILTLPKQQPAPAAAEAPAAAPA